MNNADTFLLVGLIVLIGGAVVIFSVSTYVCDSEYSDIAPKINHRLHENQSNYEKIQIIEEECKIYTVRTNCATYKYCFNEAVKQFIP